jgi:hypothetical protein
MKKEKTLYDQIIESIFFEYFQEGLSEVPFTREAMIKHA